MIDFLLSSVAGIAIVYVGIVAGMAAVQRRLLYRPDARAGSPAEAGVSALHDVPLLTEDGLELQAWWRPPDAGRPVVVLFHGNRGTRAHMARQAQSYLEHACGILMPDYRGYAGNPGAPSERGLRLDAEAALAFLLRQGIRSSQIVYHGFSLGSGPAVWLAARHPPAALVLEGAFADLPQAAARRYPWLPIRLGLRDRFDNLSLISAVKAPALFLHGGRDAVVPLEQAHALHAAHPGPKRLIVVEDAGHGDAYGCGAGPLVAQWLAETLR